MITTLEAQMADKPAVIVETMYLLPKHNMEDKFEAAVKAHNTKFHPPGPYVASLGRTYIVSTMTAGLSAICASKVVIIVTNNRRVSIFVFMIG